MRESKLWLGVVEAVNGNNLSRSARVTPYSSVPVGTRTIRASSHSALSGCRDVFDVAVLNRVLVVNTMRETAPSCIRNRVEPRRKADMIAATVRGLVDTTKARGKA